MANYAADSSAQMHRDPLPDFPELRPLKVLLVEDDPINMLLAQTLVQNAGHQVHTATNGQQAVDLAEQYAFDIVFMDIQMPLMDGVEATRLIRLREASIGRRTRIVALTAFAMQGDRERFIQLGMDSFMAKPVLAATLREELRAAIL